MASEKANRSWGLHWRRQTSWDLLCPLPRRFVERQIPVSDLDMWVSLSDPVKDGSWLFKGHDNEHMLGLGAGTTSHHEGGGEL